MVQSRGYRIVDRRTFLRHLGNCGLLAASVRAGFGQTALGQPTVFNLPDLENLPAGRPIAPEARSVVAKIINPIILAGPRLHERALLTALHHALCLATETEHPEQAWQRLIEPDDVVGIALDAVGFEPLATAETLAGQIVQSLENADIARERIVLIGPPPRLTQVLGTRPRTFGWQSQPSRVGDAEVTLAAVLEQVTALINVPTLSTDNVCGIAGCIKNASLPFVQRQSPWYEGACAPHLAELLATPAIRSKLRIHIVNGLRAVFDRGPLVHRDCVWPYAGLIASLDPVAADTVALEVLNTRRAEENLSAIGDDQGRLPHIHAAARLGLGTDDHDYIHVVEPAGI